MEKASETPANGSAYNSDLKPDLRKPREVLRDLMIFYDTQAKEIITDIIFRLKECPSRGTASELAFMYKKFSECADVAIRCAEKLAPYEHPKLESIEVKKELTHRFVLRAPPATIDTKEWLDKAQEEQKLLASKPGHNLIVMDEKYKDSDPYKAATKTVKTSAWPITPDEYYPDEELEDDEDDYGDN